MMAARVRLTLLLAALLPVIACSAPTEASDDESTTSVDQELRALSPKEIVGDLLPGATVSVDYTETPLYRAYRLSAKAGETVDVWARTTTPGTNAVAWLLGSSFGTLARNDDASSSTKDAHLVHRVAAAGTYYVVVREVNLEEAHFVVTRAGSAEPPVHVGPVAGGAISASATIVLQLRSTTYGTCLVHPPAQTTVTLDVSGSWPAGLEVASGYSSAGRHRSKAGSAGSFNFYNGGLGYGAFRKNPDGTFVWPLVADITSYSVTQNAGTVSCTDVGGYTARLIAPMVVVFSH
jgi:hypothetical protein